jgi:hypothetical protein
MFLCGIDNSGNVAYSQFINGGGDDVMALDMYNGCSLYLGGDILTLTLTLGAFTVTHTASEVLFIAKFNTGINSPTLNLAPSYTLCQGSTMTLSASGANTYTWTNGPNTNSQVISPVSTTSYVIAGTSTAGCSTKSVVNVVVLPNTVTMSAVSHTPFCNGNSATLSVAGANTSTWSTGSNNASLTVSPGTNSVYVVSGSAASGCYYSSNFTINVIANTPITATASQTTVCKGKTATLTANGGNFYDWSGGPKQAAYTVSATVSNTYFVTGTNSANGCVTTATVQLQVINCTEIGETDEGSSITVFPNPANGELNIRGNKHSEDARILLRNVAGEIIYSGLFMQDGMRINGVSPGVYFISLVRPGVRDCSRKVIIE